MSELKMSDERELEKQLKIAAKTGNYIVGRREVQSGIKGSKLLVWSASANLPQGILDECRGLSVPAFRFSGNPVELGRACGIPFRVSVIALKSPGDADISAFSKASDYVATMSTMMLSTTSPQEKEEEEKQPPQMPTGKAAEGKKDQAAKKRTAPKKKAEKEESKKTATKKAPASKKTKGAAKEKSTDEGEEKAGTKTEKKSASAKSKSPSRKKKKEEEE
jgi:large subunit ribosomal protein L30e